MIGEGGHIGKDVVIGDNCRVQNHSILYEGVLLEDEVFIGPNVITTNDMYPRVGGGWEERFRRTLFERGCSVGANTTVVCGVTLHRNSMVAAGAVVTREVERNTLVICVPARHDKYLY